MTPLEIEKLLADNDTLRSLLDKLSAERDAALAARESAKRLLVETVGDERARRVVAEKERDDLRAAIERHRSLLTGGIPSNQDATLWRAAGIEVSR